MHQTLAAVLYAFLFILAFCTGPLVVPRFIHQDPVIAAHADTPDVATISGWYGPGAWIALILTSLSAAWSTMSMSWHIIRHHTLSILALGPNDTCDRTYHNQWPGDADLIVLLVYASFATVDLTQHSLQIMRADVPHIEPPKMPAMQASATAVFVSCGLAHVMLVPLAFTGLCESKSTFSFIRSCWRRLLITTALLLTTYTGIFICYQSQEMIVARDKSALTLTSLGPDGTASLIFAFAFLVMYPSLTISFARFWSINFLVAPLYFACLYGVSSLVFPDHFSEALRKPWSSVIWARTAIIAVIAWFVPLAIFLFFNLVVLQPLVLIGLFWPAIWLSFTPGSGFFPYSAIAVTELDQLGALVTMLVVSALRLAPWIGQRMLKWTGFNRDTHQPEGVELFASQPNGEEAA